MLGAIQPGQLSLLQEQNWAHSPRVAVTSQYQAGCTKLFVTAPLSAHELPPGEL